MTTALLEQATVAPALQYFPAKRQPMTVCVISDTHLAEPKLPNADLLIHCGDLTYEGTSKELKQVDKWFERIETQFKYGIVYIAGNHDFMFQDDPSLASFYMKHGTYLEDDGVYRGGWHIYGSPWTPQFGDWAFMDKDENLTQHWNKAPQPLEVLVTHGPMKGVMDLTAGGDNAGSTTLHRLNPRYHFFGHIHEGHGVKRLFDTTYVNAAIMDEQYNPINSPILVTLEDDKWN